MNKYKVTITHSVEVVVEAETEAEVWEWAQCTTPEEAKDAAPEGEQDEHYDECVEAVPESENDLVAAIVIK